MSDMGGRFEELTYNLKEIGITDAHISRMWFAVSSIPQIQEFQLRTNENINETFKVAVYPEISSLCLHPKGHDCLQLFAQQEWQRVFLLHLKMGTQSVKRQRYLRLQITNEHLFWSDHKLSTQKPEIFRQTAFKNAKSARIYIAISLFHSTKEVNIPTAISCQGRLGKSDL